MRIIGHIPHEKISITVFSMNDKYQVQFEAGPMIQTFKLNHSDVKDGLEGIKKMLDDDFMKKISDRFNEMYLSLKQAKEKLNTNG
jgi:hypothetical protein